MDCNKTKKGIIKFKKYGHNYLVENIIFYNEQNPLFGISKDVSPQSNSWAVVHIPTESSLISCFNTKSDAEYFLDLLNNKINLDSLILYSFDASYIQDQLSDLINITYKKFFLEKRSR